MTDYAARLSPLGGETRWTLEGAALTTEARGKTSALHPLGGLTCFILVPALPRRPHPSLILHFGQRRLAIPAASFGPRGIEPRLAEFSAFARALAAEGRAAAPAARFVMAGGADHRSPLIWAIALLGAGAGGMVLTAFGSVTGGLGLSLAAWLAFAALVLAAILPWLSAPELGFDPLAIPSSILPH